MVSSLFDFATSVSLLDLNPNVIHEDANSTQSSFNACHIDSITTKIIVPKIA